MSLVDNNRFRTYALREEEIIAGTRLSELQRQCIQNLISSYAHDIINVQYDDNKPHEAEYRRSYYRGCIEALEHVLHADEEVTQALEEYESDPAHRDIEGN